MAKIHFKKIIGALLLAGILFSSCASSGSKQETVSAKYAGKTVEEILKSLTLKEKAAQMVQPAVYRLSTKDCEKTCYGSILSNIGSPDAETWRYVIDGLQKATLKTRAALPFLYGQDDVHGVNYCRNAVYFPHNIGLGAANDPELMYQVGLATADEAKLCHMLWNFAPCVAQSADPRWGRTYESFGADLERIKALSVPYTRGLIDGGVAACPKHFFGEGNVAFGTGDCKFEKKLMDRGQATLSDEEIEKQLSVYQELVKAGAQTIMVSFSSLNGVKMHENKKYIDYLKNEMGFDGFIISDWNGIQLNKEDTYEEQIIASINAGVDMMMEVDTFDKAIDIVVDAVNEGSISIERIDDAVSRILKVKKDLGLFEDPMFTEIQTVKKETGSEEYRKLAEKLVEESLVLLKNKNNVLPLKSGTNVYICGPSADSTANQCGGWTIDWNGSNIEPIPGVTTIRKGFEKVATETGIKIVKKPENADVILLCVGEQPYAEWNGDSADIELCGSKGLDGNRNSISKAKEYGKPVVTCIIAGRQVIYEKYDDFWDGVVMCYLPGSEGQGIANVLTGKAPFTGKLPSPWYSSVEQIGTGDCKFPIGYGLEY